MNETPALSSKSAPQERTWRSCLRIPLVVLILCAIPVWLVIMSVKQEMRVASFRAQGFEVASPGSPDAITGLVAIALQCGGLVISRVSKDRRPLLIYLYAVPVPVVIGALITCNKYRELGETIAKGAMFSSSEIGEMYSEFWTHTYFGAAASVLVLFLIIWALAWKRPIT